MKVLSSYRTGLFLSEAKFPKIAPSSTAVIFGNYGDGNVGDEAILDVLLDLLVQQKVKKVIVPSRAPENLKSIHRRRYHNNNNNNGLLCPVGIARGALSALFSDVLIIGGGTLFSHFSGKGIYPMLIVSIIRKLLTGRKTVFYGIGYSSSTPDSLKKLARAAFNRSDGVYVRDSLSYRLLSKVIDSDRLFLEKELAFSLQPDPGVVIPSSVTEKRADHNTLVGFSLLYTFSTKDATMIQAVVDFIKNISEKIDAGFVFLTLNPAFIDRHGIRMSDEKAGKEVVSRLPGRIASRCIVLPVYPPHEMLEIVGQLDCVISMRYHGLVFARMKNKPYIAISFEDKHAAFIQDFGGETIDFEKISAGELGHKWEKINK
jgi:polysaccharide pyruvyl transferase WcaK-like protein